MSHPNQIEFVKLCSSILAEVYSSPKIAEMGSYDVNGSTRPIFNYASEYIGVDLTSGPSVDVICSAHEFGESNQYDIVLACEVFEHNPYWLETFFNMIRICKPGGTVVFTCASRGRPEHGTARTLALESPGTSAEGWNYYRNLNSKDFSKRADLASHFVDYVFYSVRTSHDLYFVGIKNATQGPRSTLIHNWIQDKRNYLDENVARLNRSPSHPSQSMYGRLHQATLQVAARILPDRHFQSFCYYGPLIKGRILRTMQSPSVTKKSG